MPKRKTPHQKFSLRRWCCQPSKSLAVTLVLSTMHKYPLSEKLCRYNKALIVLEHKRIALNRVNQ